MAVWGGLTNSCEKKRSEKQRRKGKIQASECRAPKIARRDKKAFLRHQCKEIEVNNRMGKTRDLFKKIRYQGNISCKDEYNKRMETIWTQQKQIKKRWQKYTKLYKKDLHDPDNHDGVVTHLEPDILECLIKYVLGSITTNKGSGGDGIPAETISNPKR